MLNRSIAIASLLALGVAVGGSFYNPAPAGAQTVLAQDNSMHVVGGSGKVRKIVKSPADCEPSQARPVWGQGAHTGAPLGYRCTDNANGN